MKILNKFGKLFKTSKLPQKAQTIQHVAIFGSAHAPLDGSLVKEVIKVCKMLAETGYTIIDGGGPGVMRAATIGAKLGGGKVIGVTLYPAKNDLLEFEGRDSKNVVDREIKTTNYVQRTLTLMREGQVYVVFNGGTGTISEFGMAWGLAKLYFGHHKPLILYGNFWHDIMRCFKKNMIMRPEELKVYKIVDSPEEVLEAIKDFELEIARGEHEHLKTTKGDFSN